MPVEVLLLRGEPVALEACPKCAARPLEPFMRGQVQRWPWRLRFRWPWSFFEERPYCAVICWACKEIVGWE